MHLKQASTLKYPSIPPLKSLPGQHLQSTEKIKDTFDKKTYKFDVLNKKEYNGAVKNQLQLTLWS